MEQSLEVICTYELVVSQGRQFVKLSVIRILRTFDENLIIIIIIIIIIILLTIMMI
jgi:hypothetical protein